MWVNEVSPFTCPSSEGFFPVPGTCESNYYICVSGIASLTVRIKCENFQLTAFYGFDGFVLAAGDLKTCAHRNVRLRQSSILSVTIAFQLTKLHAVIFLVSLL